MPYSALAQELCRLLNAAEITTPVVIVAHSLGTVIARSTAALHTQRVAGMVLIDGAADDVILWPGSQRPQDGDTDQATLLDFQAGAAELAAAAYQPMPVIVLARTPGRWTSPQATPQVDARWTAQQQSVADELDAVLIIADNAGHHIQEDAPELVSLAIRAVVAAAQDGRLMPQVDPQDVLGPVLSIL